MSANYTCDDPVISGQYTHECNKKDCAYCDLMNRETIKPNRKDGWSSWELAYLETNYRVTNTARISEVLNRTPSSIWRKKFDLNKAKKAA